VLIEACAKLAAHGVPFQLEVVGHWQRQEFADRVHHRIRELNLHDRVRFLGTLIGDVKFVPYRRADVFCFPTYFECESFGLVLLEAMACGLPVVSTRWRGIPSVVEDGETGFLVETHDPEAVADRLACLAQNVELREQMGHAGRQRFERDFTISQHLERMRNVFLEVADSANRVVHEMPEALVTS
jgi:glycosyltransferase involved in cell wall biosynthesis